MEAAIVGAKREKPHWGARKIRERLLRRLPHAMKIRAASTIHAVLDRSRFGDARQAIPHASRRLHYRRACIPTICGAPTSKGEFQLGDNRYCYPLTVTAHASRYLPLCEAPESNREELAFRAFERLFQERGLPRAIRSDNDVPFASPPGLLQLSKLSLLLSLSIVFFHSGCRRSPVLCSCFTLSIPIAARIDLRLPRKPPKSVLNLSAPRVGRIAHTRSVSSTRE